MRKFPYKQYLTALPAVMLGAGVAGVIFALSNIVLFPPNDASAQTNSPPPAAGWPAGTGSVRTNVTYDYASFLGPDPDSDQVKLILDWGDGTAFESPFYALIPGTGSKTIFTSHAWSSPGTYTVRAKERDANGLESTTWSTSITVTVANNANHLPPVPAAPTGPNNVNTQTSYQYSTYLYPDIDGDQVQAVFDWGDGSAFTATPFITPQVGGTEVLASHVWAAATPAGVFGYYIKAQARENFGAGLETAWSAPMSVSAAIPPSTPAGLSALAVSSTRIDLSWTASIGNIGYKIYRNGSFLTNTTVASYGDSGLSANTSYSYTVAGYNSIGSISSQSTAVSATTQSSVSATIPTAPTSLFVGGSSPTSIGIYWADNSTNESDFKIERRFNGGSWSQVGSVVGNAATKAATNVNTLYTDNNLSGAGTYDYRVKACNSAGCSAESNTTSSTIDAAAPAVPSGLTATYSSTAGSVMVRWTDNSNNEWGFRLSRRVSGGTSWFGLASVFNNSTGNSVFYADTYQLATNTTYDYVVRSYNTYESADSNIVTVTTGNTSSGDTTPPSVPASISATAMSTSSIQISWPASTDNVAVSNYKIYRGGTQISWTSGLSYTDINLSPGKTYTYTIAVVDTSNNLSAQSSQVSATTVGGSTATPTSTSTPPPAAIPTPTPPPIATSPSQTPVGVPSPTSTPISQPSPTSPAPMEQCLEAGGLWCYSDFSNGFSGYCAPAKSACERGEPAPHTALPQPPTVDLRAPAPEEKRAELQAQEQFLTNRRAVLQDLRALERLVKRDIIEVDPKQLKIFKEKILSLKPGDEGDSSVLQSYREQISDLQDNTPTSSNREPTTDPRLEARALKQLKQALRLFERHITTLETKVTQIKKSGIIVDAAIIETIVTAKDMARRVKEAKLYGDIQDIAEQMPDVGQALNDALPRLEELLRLPGVLRLADRRISDGEKAIKQAGASAKRLKLELTDKLEAMQMLVAEAKSAVVAVKTGGATEGLLDTLREQVFDKLDDVFNLADHIRAVASVKQSVNRAGADVKHYQARRRRLKAGSDDRQAASELVRQFKEHLAGLKELSAQKLTADIGDQIIDRLNGMADLKTELEDALGLGSPDVLQEQIKRLFAAPRKKIKPFKIEQLERGVL